MTTRTSSNHSHTTSRTPAEDDRFTDSLEHSPNSMDSFDHIETLAAADQVPAAKTSLRVETVTKDVDSLPKRLLPTSLRRTEVSPMMMHPPSEEQTNQTTQLDDFLLLPGGTCRAPTQVTPPDAVSKVPCVRGCPAPECHRHSTHRIPGCFQHPSGLYPWMDVQHKGFRGHDKAGGPYYSSKEAEAIRRRGTSRIPLQGKAPTPKMRFPRSKNWPKTTRSTLGGPPT
jgi:hypothetical protein